MSFKFPSLYGKSLAMCTFNTNELIQQKEAKRFSRSIRLDSKIPLLRVLTIGWTEKQGQILCTLGKVKLLLFRTVVLCRHIKWQLNSMPANESHSKCVSQVKMVSRPLKDFQFKLLHFPSKTVIDHCSCCRLHFSWKFCCNKRRQQLGSYPFNH